MSGLVPSEGDTSKLADAPSCSSPKTRFGDGVRKDPAMFRSISFMTVPSESHIAAFHNDMICVWHSHRIPAQSVTAEYGAGIRPCEICVSKRQRQAEPGCCSRPCYAVNVTGVLWWRFVLACSLTTCPLRIISLH